VAMPKEEDALRGLLVSSELGMSVDEEDRLSFKAFTTDVQV